MLIQMFCLASMLCVPLHLFRFSSSDTVEKIKAYPPNQKRIAENKLKIIDAYYELDSGKIIYSERDLKLGF